MNNIASIIILIMLAITYLQSGYDKLFYWKGNVEWLKSHFSQSILKNQIPLALGIVLILELITAVLCVAGTLQLIFTNDRSYGLYGAIWSCVTLLFLLFGQRLAKDYDGARTIIIYFIPSVLAVYWLS